MFFKTKQVYISQPWKEGKIQVIQFLSNMHIFSLERGQNKKGQNEKEKKYLFLIEYTQNEKKRKNPVQL